MDDINDIFLYFKSKEKYFLLPLMIVLLIFKFSYQKKIIITIILSAVFLFVFKYNRTNEKNKESISFALSQEYSQVINKAS